MTSDQLKKMQLIVRRLRDVADAVQDLERRLADVYLDRLSEEVGRIREELAACTTDVDDVTHDIVDVGFKAAQRETGALLSALLSHAGTPRTGI